MVYPAFSLTSSLNLRNISPVKRVEQVLFSPFYTWRNGDSSALKLLVMIPQLVCDSTDARTCALGFCAIPKPPCYHCLPMKGEDPSRKRNLLICAQQYAEGLWPVFISHLDHPSVCVLQHSSLCQDTSGHWRPLSPAGARLTAALGWHWSSGEGEEVSPDWGKVTHWKMRIWIPFSRTLSLKL